MTTTRVLGIDPGLNITGYGMLEISTHHARVLEAGVLRSKRHDPIEKRLAALHTGLLEIIEQYKPAVMSVEQLYSHYERPRTAILMGHARGVLCLAAGQHDVQVHSYSATQIKKLLTGSGRAPKNQVQEAVRRELQLPSIPDPPDVADALAAAICHFHLFRNQAILS